MRHRRYRPLSDSEHFDRVLRTRAELEAQLMTDYPQVTSVQWDEDTVRALDGAGALLATGPSIVTLRAILAAGHG